MPVWQKIQEPLTQGANLGEVVGINRILLEPLTSDYRVVFTHLDSGCKFAQSARG